MASSIMTAACRSATPLLLGSLGAFAFHPGRRHWIAASTGNPGFPPFPDPDPDPAPDPDPVPIPGPGTPGLDPGFPDSPGFPQPVTI